MTMHSLSDPLAPPALSAGEREELTLLGLLDDEGRLRPFPCGPARTAGIVTRRPITHHGVLNEAYDYAIPSSFSRGLVVDVAAGTRMLLISGTASIDDAGVTVHKGDFRAQCWRTWRNITELLTSEGACWHDIVRTSCYLRDIERDYQDFNEVRTTFFASQGLDPLPASTGIQARLCREDLLIEIEAIAMLPPETSR